ncbi:uncharacterized protein LOC127732852 [Mytilus californianus]|uniref:uncharacterized protein LOC127732852 n=1 Tax=Mytilus californianus TaxID=6549 RepID=UPI002247C62A|nr:uncharacterized protein LOC127732852 [Mytilus californianus]
MEAKSKRAEQTYDELLSENASLKTVIECLNEQKETVQSYYRNESKKKEELKAQYSKLQEQYKEKSLAASECGYLKRKFKLKEVDDQLDSCSPMRRNNENQVRKIDYFEECQKLKKIEHHLQEQLHKAKEEHKTLLNIINEQSNKIKTLEKEKTEYENELEYLQKLNLKSKEMSIGLFENDVGESWLDPRCNSKLHVELRCKYSSCNTSDRAQLMLTDRVLNKIAHELGSDWKKLLLHLDMKHNQMQLIEGNYNKDIHRQAFEGLISWRDSKTSKESALKRVDRLKQASFSIDRQDIVDLIESVLKELLTDKKLKEIAYWLSKDWRTAFLDLGMKYTDVVMIERDYCSDLLTQAFEALILWRNVHSKKLSHHEMLIQLKNVAHNIQTRAVIELIDKIETGCTISKKQSKR